MKRFPKKTTLSLFTCLIFPFQTLAYELRPGQSLTIGNNETSGLENIVTVITHNPLVEQPITLNITSEGALRQTTTQAQAQAAFHFTTPPPANCAVYVDLTNLGLSHFTMTNAGVVSAAASQPLVGEIRNPGAPYYSPAIYLGGRSRLIQRGTVEGDIQIDYHFSDPSLNQVVIDVEGGRIRGDVFTSAAFGEHSTPRLGRVNFNHAFTTEGHFTGFSHIAFNSVDPVNVFHAISADTLQISANARAVVGLQGVLIGHGGIQNNGNIRMYGGALHGNITGQGTLEILTSEVSLAHAVNQQRVTVHNGAALALEAGSITQSPEPIRLQGNSTLRLRGGRIETGIQDDGASLIDIAAASTASHAISAARIEVNPHRTGGTLTTSAAGTLNHFDRLTVFPEGVATIGTSVTGNNAAVIQNYGQMNINAGTTTATNFQNAQTGVLSITGGRVVPHIQQTEEASLIMTQGHLQGGITNQGRGRIEIHSGRIEGVVTNHHPESRVTITGGVFEGGFINHAGSVRIRGGVFERPILHQGGRLHLDNANITAQQGLVNQGVLALRGRSVIHGNYTQGAEATLATSIRNQEEFGRLVVEGAASIAPQSRLRVDLENPHQIHEGEVFDIILAQSGIIPTISIQTAQNSPFRFNQVPNGNTLRISAARSYYLSRMATTTHALTIANAIEDLRFVNNQPAFTGLINYLDNSPRTDMNQTLTALAPNHTRGLFYGGLAPISLSMNKAATRMDLRRMDVDTVGTGYSAGEFLSGAGSYGPFFFMNTLRQADHGNFQGYRAGTEGLGILADAQITDCLQLGAGLAYAGTRVRTEVDSGRTHINSGEIMLYGGYGYNAAFLDAVLVGAHNRYHMKRDIIPGLIVGYSKHRGYQFSGKLRGGFDLPAAGCVIVTPMAMVQYTNLHQNKFFERTIITRFTAAQNSHLTQAGAGFKLSFMQDITRYVPEIHAMYLRDLNNPKLQVTSTFTNAGAAFTVLGPFNQYKNSINIGGSLSACLAEDVLVMAGYDYEGKRKLHSHSASLRFRWLY